MPRSFGPASTKHKHHSRRRLAIEPLAPRVVLSADMHFAAGELERFGSETHEHRLIDARGDERSAFSATAFGGRDDFDARREHGGPRSRSMHTIGPRGASPPDYGWAPISEHFGGKSVGGPASVQHIVVIVPASSGSIIAPGLSFPQSSPPPSILGRPAPLSGLSLGGGGPLRATGSSTTVSVPRGGASVTTVSRRSAPDSVDGQTLIAHALAATPRGEVTSARAVGYASAATTHELGATPDGKSWAASGLDSRSSSARTSASRAEGSASSDEKESDEGGLIELDPKRPSASSSAKMKAEALRQARRRSEADAWLSEWLRSLDSEFAQIADELASALGAVARQGRAPQLHERYEPLDDEGGLIELLATGRGEADRPARAMISATACPTIADTNVEIDAVVRLFQAFEIATVPAADDATGATDDTGDTPAKPKAEVEDAGEDGLGARAALPGLGFATLVLGSLDGTGQREGSLSQRLRRATLRSRRRAAGPARPFAAP